MSVFAIAKVDKKVLCQVQPASGCSGYSFNKRELWTEREDNILRELMKHETNHNLDWNHLAEVMTKKYDCKLRVGKQLRERWINHLDPGVVKDYWSEMEESILFSKQFELGNRWSEISKFLPGRTDNSIKNYFYSRLRRQVRLIVKIFQKSKMLEKRGIPDNVYEPHFVYKLVKDLKLSYQEVTKSRILEIIENHLKGSYVPLRKSRKKWKQISQFSGSAQSIIKRSNPQPLIKVENRSKPAKLNRRGRKRLSKSTKFLYIISKQVFINPLGSTNQNCLRVLYINDTDLKSEMKPPSFSEENMYKGMVNQNEYNEEVKHPLLNKMNSQQIIFNSMHDISHIATPSNNLKLFAPSISPLNFNFHSLSQYTPITATNSTNAFGINLNLFFNPPNFVMKDTNSFEMQPIKVIPKIEAGVISREENILKPLEKRRGLSLNMDDINSHDDNAALESTKSRLSNEGARLNYQPATRVGNSSLAISPCSAFGKANPIIYK